MMVPAHAVEERTARPMDRPSANREPGAAQVRLVEQLVLQAFGLKENTLHGPGRGRARIAFARQVAIYVTHVHLGYTLTACGVLFNRDRTTAAYACQRVEDFREDLGVDAMIRSIEEALDQWLQLSGSRAGVGAAVLQ